MKNKTVRRIVCKNIIEYVVRIIAINLEMFKKIKINQILNNVEIKIFIIVSIIFNIF